MTKHKYIFCPNLSTIRPPKTNPASAPTINKFPINTISVLVKLRRLFLSN
ncbi:MAG: hypothetical protein CM1200mP30_23040 [Pseudomonadota bacterium]|nr:MAG: hypothetical protein CM1200mP30_23040 [Pseudomonadota bacterium]